PCSTHHQVDHELVWRCTSVSIDKWQLEGAPRRRSLEALQWTALVHRACKERAVGEVVQYFQIAASRGTLIFHGAPDRVPCRGDPRSLDRRKWKPGGGGALVNHAKTGPRDSHGCRDHRPRREQPGRR